MKNKLILNKNDFSHGGTTLGMKLLLNTIGTSDLFDVEFHDETIKAMRGERASIIYFNNKKIYLDLWEYSTPTHTMEILNAKFDLIIKVQHRILSLKDYNRYCDRKRVMKGTNDQIRTEYLAKIVPWTFFPSKMMEPYVGKEDELEKENIPIERDCFFCGKDWKCRKEIIKSLIEQGIECVFSNQELRQGKTLSHDDYLHKMKSSKYGLVVRGRSTPLTDCKNRREIDYMILKKPLLIDYEPYYYNPMVAGKHYILINKNTNIKSLESMYNMKDIANNGYEWYKNNASPSAISKTFLQIMTDRFGKGD
jgi:hypothetical protein